MALLWWMGGVVSNPTTATGSQSLLSRKAGSDIRASRTQAWERTPPTPLECTAFSSVLEAKQGRFRIDALSSLRPGSVSDVR
eukprot:883053-Rhodomonas_salina.5